MHRIQTTKAALLAAILGAIGCGPSSGITLLEEGEESGRTPYVVNGQTHSGHPSAGMLTHSGSLCTATLIGKKTVLTAGHCVSPGSSHTFTTDDGVKHLSAAVYRHENYNAAQISDDVAVIILATAPAVAPIPINLTAPSSGTELTIVGFGKTSEYGNDAGVKRMAKNKISQVTTTRISMPGSSTAGNLCNGDSGGPSYAMVNGIEVDVGVHSTKSGACGSGGNDMRVDVYADWITQKANGDVVKPGAAPTPPPDTTPPDTTPPAPGPDTAAPKVTVSAPGNNAQVQPSFTVTAAATDNVGVVKVELLVDGALIASASGPTVSFPVVLKAGGHTLQLNAADAAGNKGQASLAVTVVDGSTPTPPAPTPTPPTTPPDTTPPTIPPAPSPGLFGTTCQSSKDCQSGLCANDAELGQNYCTQACSASLACPSGATCFSAANSTMQVCGPPSMAPGPGLGGDEEQLVGSCSVASATDFAPAPILFLFAVLFLARRRSRR